MGVPTLSSPSARLPWARGAGTSTRAALSPRSYAPPVRGTGGVQTRCVESPARAVATRFSADAAPCVALGARSRRLRVPPRCPRVPPCAVLCVVAPRLALRLAPPRAPPTLRVGACAQTAVATLAAAVPRPRRDVAAAVRRLALSWFRPSFGGMRRSRSRTQLVAERSSRRDIVTFDCGGSSPGVLPPPGVGLGVRVGR